MNDRLSHIPTGQSLVPAQSTQLYQLCWQLEMWLRELVYVEIKTLCADWEARIAKAVTGWPPDALRKDKGMTHMVTPHRLGTSYLSLGQLWCVITNDENWPVLEDYFPPKGIAEERIKEVKAIRNRIAHFRAPHPTDCDRLTLFLRDMEDGLRRFCDRYTNPVFLSEEEAAAEPVSRALEAGWDRIGYGVEMERDNGGWLYAPGRHRSQPPMHAKLSLLMRRSRKEEQSDGLCYRLLVWSLQRELALYQVLRSTSRVHEDIIHIAMLASMPGIVVTIPAAIGTDRVVAVISAFLSEGYRSLKSSGLRRSASPSWPEYVLAEDHPIVAYDGPNSPMFEYS